jgi:dTDP-4-amino-4,6-dideoxygalactose transaminase
VRLAEDHKCRFVDIRLALELDVEAVGEERVDDPPFTIRKAVAGDIPVLRDLARIAHRDSRFYNDGNFPVELCDALYDAWIEKSCRGWAENVLVAETGDEIQGYVTCQMANSEGGQIGLVRVSDKTQGKGNRKGIALSRDQMVCRRGRRENYCRDAGPKCSRTRNLLGGQSRTEQARQALIAQMKEREILSVFHYMPLHLSEMGRRWGGKEGVYPVTESVSDRVIRLPFYNELTEADQDRVVAAVCEFACA